MRVTIDLAQDDQSGWRGGQVEWSDPCTLEDMGAITFHLGPVDLSVSYGQFETLLDNILRWRWSLPAEGGPVDLTADCPPPTWDDYVRALATETAGERHTLATELDGLARNHGLLPKPEDGDKAALRAYIAGRSVGVREGLLKAAELIRQRMASLDPPSSATPPRPDGGRDGG